MVGTLPTRLLHLMVPKLCGIANLKNSGEELIWNTPNDQTQNVMLSSKLKLSFKNTNVKLVILKPFTET